MTMYESLRRFFEKYHIDEKLIFERTGYIFTLDPDYKTKRVEEITAQMMLLLSKTIRQPVGIVAEELLA